MMRLIRVSIIVAILALVFFLVDSFSMDANVEAAPIASFTYSPRYPEVGENVTFNASSSAGEGLSYSWNFGDDTRGSGMTASHAYGQSGYYTVTLTISNSSGAFDSDSQSIYVEEENPVLVWGFLVGILLIYILIFMSICLGYLINPIVGGICAYKGYDRALKLKRMDIAKPYLWAHLIAGIVSLLMVYFWLFSVIAHIVIYVMLKKKLDEAE